MIESLNDIPEVNRFSSFPFSAKTGLTVKKDLESQLSNMSERLDRIVQGALVGDVPLLKFVLQTSHDKDELKTFAKAVDRVADIIEVIDQLESRISIIDTAQKDPEWFLHAFADFSQEIDEDHKKLTVI